MTGKVLLCFCILTGVVISTEASAAVFHDSLLTNGKFDDGLLAWTGSNVNNNNLEDQYALDGQFLTLGQIGQTQAVSQTVTVPTEVGQATLSFFYRLYTDDASAGDYIMINFTRNDTGAVIVGDTIPASAGDVTTWTKYTVDVSRLVGKTVTMTIGVVNNASQFTFVDMDTIRLNAYSYGELKGTVHNNDGQALRNAAVTIRKPNGDKLWTGTTNKKGKFTAELLPGNTKKYRIIIKKNDVTLNKRASINWGEQTKQTFTFPNL